MCLYYNYGIVSAKEVRTRAAEEQLLNILKTSTERGRGQAPHGNAPLPTPPHSPVSLEKQQATQNELMRLLMENETCHGADHPQPQQQDKDSSYLDFLATHPPLFSEATNPLEVDNWLCTTKYKFGLLHYTKYQKTLYAAQHL
jgi:hypothetical protein